MNEPLIEDFLNGDSKEIRDIASNEAVLIGFLTLAKTIDDLPDLSLRFYEESRSLYQVTSTGHSLVDLAGIMSSFFGAPVKAPGKNLPVALRFDPTVKYLGGIRKDQALFLKKLKTGSFFGALWPWQRDKKKIEIHLGYCSTGMSDADYNRLRTLVTTFLSHKKIETISEVGGQIHGISLPSFLQMSEMEGATYSLKVTSGARTGRLYLDGGSLIAAQYEEQTGNEAAYRIISWDNAAIQIEAADPDRVREINDPLMHVMMESLKIKDEAGDQPTPPPADRPVPVHAPPSDSPDPMDRPASEEEARPTATPTGRRVKPEPKQPTEKVPAPPLSVEPIESVPFEKATDRSLGRQDQMSRTVKLLIVLGVVIVFAIVVAGGGALLKKNRIDRRYDRLLADLADTQVLDARIVLLMKYIAAHPKDAHRSELEARLNDAYAELEKRDFEKTIAAVGRLPIDEKYEKKALSLYTAFSAKHPQSVYAGQIDEAVGGIRQLLGSARYEDLKQLAGTDFQVRYAAYRDYLERFPQGAEREAVEQWVVDLAREYAASIQKSAAACDARHDWRDCIVQCDRFLSLFNSGTPAETIGTLRSVLQDKQDLAALTAEASLTGDDLALARRIYSDYLETKPQTTQRETIAARIEELNDRLARRAKWNITHAYATDPVNDIFSRVQRLDAYAKNNASGPYIVPARTLREQLEPELQEALHAQQLEATRHRELARQQAEQARRARETQRIQGLQDQVAGRLQPLAGRFVNQGNGVVTDRVTGLEWCLLDSHLDLGRCLSYEQAKEYVRRLGTGGHTNWRLPTAGELASLYKNSPFFPGTGAAWYWTSESFARGYHRVVDVVTSVPETVFTRMSKNEESCGSVRAVRR